MASVKYPATIDDSTPLKRFAKLGLLTSVAAFGLLAATVSASAVTVTIDAVDNWASEPSTPPTSPFSLLPLGTDTVGINQVQTATGFSLDGVSIAFNSGSNPASGEYAGSGSGFASAFGGNNGSQDYLLAGGENAASPGIVTVTYGSAQTTLSLLWGTVDSGVGDNDLSITADGYTVTGADILQDAANQGFGTINGGVDNMYLQITGLGSFTTVTFEDSATASFEFVPGLGATATQVPEPASIAIFGAALFGLGFLGLRRRRKVAA